MNYRNCFILNNSKRNMKNNIDNLYATHTNLYNIFKNEIYKLVIKNKENKEYLNKYQAILYVCFACMFLFIFQNIGNIIIINISQ